MWAVVKKSINSTLGKHTKTIDEICELESYKNFYENLRVTKLTSPSGTAIYRLDYNKIRIPVQYYDGADLPPVFVVNPSVRIIERSAFDSAVGLQYIYIPPHCEIQTMAFWGSSVTSFDFPNGTKIIADQVLANCAELAQIDIPYSVKEISHSAFSNAASLQRIYYYGTKSDWSLIEKGTDWDSGTGNYTVYCLDGNIKKGT